MNLSAVIRGLVFNQLAYAVFNRSSNKQHGYWTSWDNVLNMVLKLPEAAKAHMFCADVLNSSELQSNHTHHEPASNLWLGTVLLECTCWGRWWLAGPASAE